MKERGIWHKRLYHMYSDVIFGWILWFWLSSWHFYLSILILFRDRLQNLSGDPRRPFFRGVRRAAVAAAPAVVGASRLLRPPQRQRRPGVPTHICSQRPVFTESHFTQPKQSNLLSQNEFTQPTETPLCLWYDVFGPTTLYINDMKLYTLQHQPSRITYTKPHTPPKDTLQSKIIY